MTDLITRKGLGSWSLRHKTAWCLVRVVSVCKPHCGAAGESGPSVHVAVRGAYVIPPSPLVPVTTRPSTRSGPDPEMRPSRLYDSANGEDPF